jgi:glyoxylase-like metal-dependent hydrolase (beta-lactamase superfamily II)
MRTLSVVTAALLLSFLTVGARAQDAKAVIEEASKALGVTGLTSITYSGSAALGNFGQSRTISFGLTSTSIRGYTSTIDFTRPAARATGILTAPASPGGPSYAQGEFDQTIAASDGWAQQFQMWVTPWGFLRGAAANNPTLRMRRIESVPYKEVTWVPPLKAPSGQSYRVVGYINPDNLVERVETWVEHPVLGDMHVEMRFESYRSFGGLQAPTRMAQRQTGMEMFVVGITSARANPADLGELLAASTAAAREPVTSAARSSVTSEKLADGVYRVTGAYTSLVVEFRDHVVVLEAGENEARGLALIAEAKRLFPGKRIKYVVNTHPHFDHSSGLAPFVADGVTLITDDNNKFFVDAALGSPRTLVGDTLAKARKKPKVEGVIEKMVLRDETRTIELHHVAKLEHSDGMLIAYLPKERILFTADFDAPEPGERASSSIVTLAQNLERLAIDFDRHVPVHPAVPDRPMTRAELLALAKGAD